MSVKRSVRKQNTGIRFRQIITMLICLLAVMAITAGCAKEKPEAVRPVKGEKQKSKLSETRKLKPPEITSQTVEITEAVPFAEQHIQDANLAKGKSEIQKEGVNGVKTKFYQVTLKDGKETSRTFEKEAITVEPVPKIIADGTKEPKLQQLSGAKGVSSEWGSGWMDLNAVTDFHRGDTLRLQIGGTAEKILVRLLGKDVSPDSPSGIVGGAISVPNDRVVVVLLDADYPTIVQISVHGGSNPWGLYPLGDGNGPATIESATAIR